MEDEGKQAYLRASVRDAGSTRKCVQIPRNAGHLTGLLNVHCSGQLRDMKVLFACGLRNHSTMISVRPINSSPKF